MSVAIEEKRIRSLFDRVETVEDVARTLPEDDERRARSCWRFPVPRWRTRAPSGRSLRLGCSASAKDCQGVGCSGTDRGRSADSAATAGFGSVHQVSQIVRELREHGNDATCWMRCGGG